MNNIDALDKRNFSYTILTISIIVFISFVILGFYYRIPRYNITTYDDYVFYLPIGYKYEIQKETDGTTDTLLFGSDVKYNITVLKDIPYSHYLYNDYLTLRTYFGSENYTIESIKELKEDNHSIIISKIHNDEKDNLYCYIYNFPDSTDLLFGYIYNDNKEIEDEDIKLLFNTLKRTQTRS